MIRWNSAKQATDPISRRADNVRQISDTGLGLIIAKRCFELHSGTLEITSAVGEGSALLAR